MAITDKEADKLITCIRYLQEYNTNESERYSVAHIKSLLWAANRHHIRRHCCPVLEIDYEKGLHYGSTPS